MANSWSFLHDEMNMSNQDYWYEDGFSLTGNPAPDSPDTITFSGNAFAETMHIGAAQPVSMDYLSLGGEDSVSFNLTMEEKNTQSKYKYSEDKILKELQDYITGTYNQHYSAGDDKIQTLDLIEACGDGESFCRSNILKYASRYDKKGTARRDIMKILHYAVLLMHFNDKNAQRETYPQ